MDFIIRNISGADLEIDDLGLFIEIAGEYNLKQEPSYLISQSVDLINAINNDDLIVLRDGNPLSKQDSLDAVGSVNVPTGLIISSLSDLSDVEIASGLFNGQVISFENGLWVSQFVQKGDLSDFNEDDYVHRTGDEEIDGQKTFKKDTIIIDSPSSPTDLEIGWIDLVGNPDGYGIQRTDAGGYFLVMPNANNPQIMMGNGFATGAGYWDVEGNRPLNLNTLDTGPGSQGRVNVGPGGLVIGKYYASSYMMSLQTNTTQTWLEILNNGGANQGVFFGLANNDFELWNYQSGDISFYTDTSPTSGIERVIIKSTGETIFKNPALIQAGLLTNPSLAFEVDTDTGLYRHSENVLGFVAGGNASLLLYQNKVFSTVIFTAPDGAETAPAYAFSLDPDTGIFRPNDNQLGITLAGTELFRFFRNGLGDGKLAIYDNTQVESLDITRKTGKVIISALGTTGNLDFEFNGESYEFEVGGSPAFKIEEDKTLTVGDTADYEDQVTDDDDIPNKAYVDHGLRKLLELGETLSAGVPVYVGNDGKAYKIYNNADNTENFGTGAPYYVKSAMIDTDKVVIAYRDLGVSNYGRVVVGEIQPDDSIVFGTPVTFSTTAPAYLSVAKIESSDSAIDPKFTLCYRGLSQQGKIIAGSVSGTTITLGSEATFNAATTSYIWHSAIDDDKVAISFQDGGASNHGKSVIATLSGLVIAVAVTEYTFSATTTYDTGSTEAGVTDKFVVAYYKSGNSFARVGSVSGTVITFGTEVQFNTSYSIELHGDSVDADKIVFTYRDDGDSNKGKGIVATISGTTITFGSEYTFANYQSWYNSVTKVDTDKIIVQFSDDAAPQTSRVSIGNISGTVITFQNEQTYYESRIYYPSVAALTTNKYVMAWYCLNSGRGYALVGNVDTAIATVADYVGILEEAGSIGEFKVVTLLSGITNAVSGLNVGWQYLQNDGSISDVVSSYNAGFAFSSTQMLVTKEGKG